MAFYCIFMAFYWILWHFIVFYAILLYFYGVLLDFIVFTMVFHMVLVRFSQEITAFQANGAGFPLTIRPAALSGNISWLYSRFIWSFGWQS